MGREQDSLDGILLSREKATPPSKSKHGSGEKKRSVKAKRKEMERTLEVSDQAAPSDENPASEGNV